MQQEMTKNTKQVIVTPAAVIVTERMVCRVIVLSVSVLLLVVTATKPSESVVNSSRGIENTSYCCICMRKHVVTIEYKPS